MVTVEEAQQQIAEQRTNIEENKRRIAEARSKLPNESSQEALRSGSLSGISGRQQRENVQEIKQELTSKEELLNQAKDEINKYSQDVSNYQQELDDYQEAQAQIQNEQDAYTAAKRLYSKGIAYNQVEGSARKYLKQLYENQNEAQAYFNQQVSSLQKSLPSSEKLIIDYNKMKISGIESGVLQSSMPISEYNKRIEEINRKISTIQNQPQLKAPLLTVEKAPTLSERFSSRISEEGIVRGTLSSIGAELGEVYQKEAVKRMRAGDTSAMYQIEPTIKLMNEAPNAIYFTPAGTPLLLISGVEEFTNLAIKGGESRIAKQSKSYQENQKLNPILSNVLAYGEPALEVFAGGLGTKLEINNLKAMREATLLEKAPLIPNIKNEGQLVGGLRYEGEKGGIDIIAGIKKISPNYIERNVLGIQPRTYETTIVQPFYKVGEEGGRIVLEGGRGVTISKAGNELEVIGFETGGRYNIWEDTVPSIIKKLKGGEVRSEILEGQSGMGRVVVNRVIKYEGKVKKYTSFKPSEGFVETTLFEGTKSFEPSKSSFNVLGVGKESKEGIISVLGGKVSKARIYPIEGKTTILGRIDEFGVIKRVKPSSEEGIEVLRPSNIKKTPFSKTFGFQEVKTQEGTATYAKGLLESSMSLSTPTKELGGESLLGTVTQMKVIPSTKEGVKEESIVDVKQNEGIKQLEEIRIIEQPRLKEELKVSNKQPTSSRELEGLSTKQPQQFRLEDKIGQPNRQRTPSITITPNKVPTKIPVPTIIVPIILSGKSNKSKAETMFEAFQVWKRIKGKDVLIGKEPTEELAFGKLKKSLKSDLSASGYVSQGENKIDISKQVDKEFRTSKVERNRIVQRKGGKEGGLGRLSTSSEISAIKSSKKKIKWL